MMKFRLFRSLQYTFLLTLVLASCHINAQSLSDLQQLQQQAQQSQSGQGANTQTTNSNTSVGSVSAFELNSSRTIQSMNNGQGSTGQYYNSSRGGQVLPGEPTIDTVYPAQAPMENPPYAANLFIGGFESERADGLNDNYLVAQGDKISIWMAVNHDIIILLTESFKKLL